MTPAGRQDNAERTARIELEVEQLEWIVSEVVRRLLAIAGAEWPAGSEPPRTPADLAPAERVITAMSLDGKLTGITRLVVPPHAVVTPAARDLLKDRQVELVRQ